MKVLKGSINHQARLNPHAGEALQRTIFPVNLLSDIGHFNVHLKSSLMRGWISRVICFCSTDFVLQTMNSFTSEVLSHAVWRSIYSLSLFSHFSLPVGSLFAACTSIHAKKGAALHYEYDCQHHTTMNTGVVKETGEGHHWRLRKPNSQHQEHEARGDAKHFEVPTASSVKMVRSTRFFKDHKANRREFFQCFGELEKKRRRTEKKMKNLEQP